MAEDTLNPSAPSAVQPSTADLSYTNPVRSDAIEQPWETDQKALDARLLQRQQAIVSESTSGYELSADIAKDTLTGAIFENLTAPAFKPDPNFTADRLEARLKEASKYVPTGYIAGLGAATSDDHFDYLVQNALEHDRRSQELAQAGLGWKTASFMANMLDPTTLAIAIGTANVGAIAANAAKVGRLGQMGINGAAGAAGAVGTVGVHGMLQGRDVENSELALAAGLGLILGGAFGPIAQNAKTAAEGAALARVGQKLVKKVEEITPQKLKALAEKRLKTAQEAEAEFQPRVPHSVRSFEPTTPLRPANDTPEMASQVARVPDGYQPPAPANDVPRVVDGSPAPTPVGDATPPATPGQAIERVLKDASDAAQGAPVDLTKSIGEAVDALTGAAKPVAAEVEPKVSAGMAIDNPVEASRVLNLKATNDNVSEASGSAGDAGAAKAEIVSHDFTDDPLWKAIHDDTVPKGFGFWRWDRGGKNQKNPNAAARLVGSYLLNDATGKAKGALNPFSADQDMLRIQNVFMGEYNRVKLAQLKEWGKSQGYNWAQTKYHANDFFMEVGRYTRGLTPEGEAHPAVKKLGVRVREVMNEARKQYQNPLRKPFVDDSVRQLQTRPIPGSELLEENEHYLWRLWQNDAVRAASDRTAFGESGLIQAFKGSFLSANEDMAENVAEELAKGFVTAIRRRAAGITDDWSAALAHGDKAQIERILMRDTRLAPEEIKAVIERFTGKPTEGKTLNMKRRMLLDEGHIERNLPHGTLGTADLAIADLLEHNIDTLMMGYVRRMAGQVALARVRVRLPFEPRFRTEMAPGPDGTMTFTKVPDGQRGGELLINGINSDAEFEKIKTMIQSWGADNKVDVKATEKALKDLQFAYERIKGIPDPAQMSDMAWYLRMLRRFQSTRLMGQVGIAQLGETAQPVATLGIRASFRAMPAIKRIIDEAGAAELNVPLFQEIEHIGIGAERLHGFHFHNFDDIDNLPFTMNSVPRAKLIDEGLRGAEQLTYELSGQNAVQVIQERMTAAALLHKISMIADEVKTGGSISRGWKERLAQLGLDDETQKAVLDQMSRHTTREASTMFDGIQGNKLVRLNLDKWDNAEARTALENAVFRMTRKLIQTPDLGSSAFWMSDPITQTFFQFRGFTFTAWANQTLYNLNVRDMNAFAAMTWSIAWNAAVRAAQVSLLAQGRSDKDKYLDKQLDPWQLAKAGFQRAGWTSILPMLADTGLAFTGQPSQFDARSSGQAADIWMGSPTISMFNQASKGIGALSRSIIGGDTMSQGEARALFGILPGSNLLPMATLYSYMIQDMPERSQAERRHHR